MNLIHNKSVCIFIIIISIFTLNNYADAQTVAGGSGVSLNVCADGTVMAWGINYSGILCNDTLQSSLVPIPIPGLTDVKAISCEKNHVLVLKNDGTVWAWGYNEFGQLGLGYTSNSGCYCVSHPVQIPGLTDVKAIATGIHHSLALKNDGTVWSWGRNFAGQLGINNNTNKSSPVQITTLSDIVYIASGNSHSMAIKNDGTLWTWGQDYNGELGFSSYPWSLVPVQVPGVSNVVSVDGGQLHTVLLKSDSTVWVCGWNEFGQLGNGTSGSGTDSHNFIQVAGLNNIIYLSSGYNHSIVMNNLGEIWGWGDNCCSQLGDTAGFDIHTTPVKIEGISRITQRYGVHQNICTKEDGTVWAWGDNNFGELGDSTIIERNVPQQVNTCLVPGVVLGVPGNISGENNVCAGSTQTYSISTVPAATYYTWIIPPDWTGSSSGNSITLTVGNTSGDLQVYANNDTASTGPSQLTITVNIPPAQPSFTQNGNILTCSVTSASYQWYVNGTMIAGANDNTYYATGYGNYQVEITDANGCSSISEAVTVNVPPAQPAQIYGSAHVCEGSSVTYSINPVYGATDYTWTIPAGWTGISTDTSITVIAALSNGNITVTANNAVGSSAACILSVNGHPIPSQPSITQSGNTLSCTVSASEYQWYLNGTIITNAIENSYFATSDGYYQVEIADVYGCSAISDSAFIQVPPQMPGPVSGNADVCVGSINTYSIDSVPEATDYTWSLPVGWTGSSTGIFIIATASASSGNVSVTANNTHGSSVARTFPVTGHSLPPKPAITTSGDYLTSSVTSSNYQWYKNNTIINGATAITYLATQTGYYQVEITDSYNCSSKSDSLFIKPSDIENQSIENQIHIYPNPVQKELIIEFDTYLNSNVELYNLQGQLLFSQTGTSPVTRINMSEVSSGFYILKIKLAEGCLVQKILKE